MPGSIGGAGLVAYPVAHVHPSPLRPIEPCFGGVDRAVLATCVHPGILAAQIEAEKARIWTDEALWEL